MKKYTLLPVLMLLIISFRSVAQDSFITAGSGGGFTGAATVYKITPKGEVFRGKGVTDIAFTECAPLSKRKAKKIIRQVNDVLAAITEFNHPGNLYYFLSTNTTGQEKRITWGDTGTAVSDDVKKLYDDIGARVSSLKYKPVKK
jgi:hypothetical protein